MGHVGRLSMSCVARRWPWAGVAWWKTSRTCPVKVGDFDTDMRFICHEGLTEAFLLTWGVLLDAAAYRIESVRGELDDMKGVQHAGCVLELVINGVLISLEGIQRRDLDTGAKLFAALGQPVLVHGARPSWDQVQQAGRGMILPASGPRCR